ncbi:ATP-binding cassette domain-containing protein [Prochlorococcus marinus]|uniref:Phosphate/phosphonate ABC transporter ATP-binding protein n=1 Tax=Prochlorococcus marinus XMU1408 TaxID=2213228 RepID=A0A318R0L3_PROMR|nr:ATP-binding cassette domain-containing protein [Prochlorococcus marinus]MBW3041696.1 phosphate/phosphonate ABC transporter ATP-binding protein [Prochlorococcus marinus str. XMU1408]PYE02846.1 phosphate/phosphonate ABC transporter ATP-binding protein [Prochlorococcus marinus XMU1408]
MNKLLELKNINHSSKESIRVKDINLTIHQGEKIALIGKSGSGKSTLISIANGSLIPNEGDVIWKGSNINNISNIESTKIGTIWQDLSLIEELNVAQNINCGALGKHNFIWALKNLLGVLEKGLCQECLAAVSLPKKTIYSNINKLSGGQKKRIAIARLLRQEPEILLGDEPFSNLDPLLSTNILNLFVNQKNYHRIKIPETILISLHQIYLINNFNRVIGLKDGEIAIDREIHNINQSEFDWLF